jgi:hypothetical protein
LRERGGVRGISRRAFFHAFVVAEIYGFFYLLKENGKITKYV